jgi:SAM-dependent methyltransferase
MGSAHTTKHLESMRRFYDGAAGAPAWSAKAYRRVLAHYYNLMLPQGCSVLEIGCGDGELLAALRGAKKTGVDISPVQLERARARLPEASFVLQAGESLDLGQTFDVIIISDTLNQAADVQSLLSQALKHAHPRTRLLVNYHNTLWRPLLWAAGALGLRRQQPRSNWLSCGDVGQLLQLSGWEIVKTQPRVLWPLGMSWGAAVLNRWLAPLMPNFCLCLFTMARPQAGGAAAESLSVSVVVPARNEAGNIEAAVLRTPEMGAWTELIFIEGHSKDNTWAEIQRVKAAYPGKRIRILQQTGRGKGNAVREAYAIAEGDILMILDADLTMPPEDLPKFYEAIASGRCEFANGSRLVYPMESKAMRFLNMIANKLFGLTFSWLLAQHVKDTLCGTKVLRREDYLKIAANRAYFGDFDPFGDFDLLFGADKLNLKIADIPIRYRDRTYGDTNIQRWRHGWLLLRMVCFAARKLKFV